jgi:Na+-transporting NADH:ubiquinone oxidoreductase subunit E
VAEPVDPAQKAGGEGMNGFSAEIGTAVMVAFAAVFTNNIILSYFLGMCSFLSVSREVKTAAGLGAAVIFVMTCTAVLNWLAYYYILVPLNLEFFRFILFIIIIAAFVQFVEMVMDRYMPKLHMALGIFLPLITVNCAIFGVVLFMVIREYSLIVTTGFGLGSGIGWLLAILAMAGIRQRLNESRVPEGLRGPGITLIIAGLMALAFIGFTGVLT